MCTIIVLWHAHPAHPLVVALNRDEFHARPTRDYHRWTPAHADVDITAGRDETSGGTWFAVGPQVVAAVTNHRGHGIPTPGRISRGRLVTEAATAPTAAAGLSSLDTIAATDAGPFHLIAADADELVYATNAGGIFSRDVVAPGLHVLGNYGLDAPDDPVVRGLLSRLEDAASLPWSELEERLKGALAAHGAGDPCVHLGPYGTRSAAILALGGAESRLLTTEGPPCTAPWRNHSHLLSDSPSHV